MANYLLEQYSKLKVALLYAIGYISSLKEVSGFENMNITMGREYINEVLLICNDTIESYAKQFNDRLERMRVMSESEKKEVFLQLGITEKDFGNFFLFPNFYSFLNIYTFFFFSKRL